MSINLGGRKQRASAVVPSMRDFEGHEVIGMLLFGRKSAYSTCCAVIGLALGVTMRREKKGCTAAHELPAQINALAKQLPGMMLEDAGPITGQIQKLVVDHMAEWMANRTPTDVETRRELESFFSLLHYPVVALPAAFAQPWKGQMVIGAGYTFGWTDFDRQNVVAIFTSSGGKSHLVTVTNFVPRVDMHY